MEVYHKIVVKSSKKKNNKSFVFESPYKPLNRNKSQSNLINIYNDENIRELFTPKYIINRKKQREPYTVHLNQSTNLKLPCIKNETNTKKEVFKNIPFNLFLKKPKNMKRIKLVNTSFLNKGNEFFKNRINAEKIDLEYHSKKNSSSFSMAEINPEQFQEAQCISNEFIKAKLLF